MIKMRVMWRACTRRGTSTIAQGNHSVSCRRMKVTPPTATATSQMKRMRIIKLIATIKIIIMFLDNIGAKHADT